MKLRDALLARIASPEAVLKLAEPASLVRFGGAAHEVRAEPVTRPVVDTTAAGDSFAAAYLAARLDGADPVAAARAGHQLAGVVVCYPGAIIPREAMPMPARRPHARRPMSALPKQERLAACSGRRSSSPC